MVSIKLTDDQLLTALQDIFTALKTNSEKLEGIKKINESIIIKWRMFLDVILPIQINIVQTLGFSADQSGLSSFNEILMKRQIDNLHVRASNKQKWDYILEKSFGIKSGCKITLEQAQNLISDLVTAMTSENFLQKIDIALSQVDDQDSILLKRQQLLTILLPLQMSVMEKHGFKGEQGYVQAQKSLTEYYHDPVVLEKANYAHDVIFKRAKLV